MRGVDKKYEWARFRLPGRWLMVATIALVALLGMTRFDMITSVEYVRSTATYVAHVPGKDWNHRIVVVHLEGKDRVLRTSDHLIDVHPGRTACVRRSQYLVRNWTRYSLALDPFCRPPIAASLAAKAQGA